MLLEKTLRVDGDRLNAVMRLRGMSPTLLATQIGKHPNTIYKLRRKETTALETVGDICEALDCHPFDILVAEGYPAPSLASPRKDADG